ncbi:hypothetical protein Q8A67_020945 [Cirrhinus molitorella]|uniref:Uncharacterized protein n=1 Tax=Cirrhinus molitorella TaxID=172907 RepID=A0AA88P647_9TELE|nr:hypothetical protein Q8A67_020945 [Cirrhinus molitorella]
MDHKKSKVLRNELRSAKSCGGALQRPGVSRRCVWDALVRLLKEMGTVQLRSPKTGRRNAVKEGHEDSIREEKRSSLQLKANPKGVEQSTCTSNQQTMRQGLRFLGIDREFLKTGLPGPGIILLGLPNPSVT